MGVPIYGSREIASNKRIPVPRKLNESICQEEPNGQKVVFWNYNKNHNLALISNKPLAYSSEAVYKKQSKYLGEPDSNGDWDIRPIEKIRDTVTSDFEEDNYVFFMLKNEWLSGDPKGAYILTTSDLPKNLPMLRRLKKFHPQLFNKNSSFDFKRPQEDAFESNQQLQSLLAILEKTGITDIRTLVDHIYTNGRVETDLELPPPGV